MVGLASSGRPDLAVWMPGLPDPTDARPATTGSATGGGGAGATQRVRLAPALAEATRALRLRANKPKQQGLGLTHLDHEKEYVLCRSLEGDADPMKHILRALEPLLVGLQRRPAPRSTWLVMGRRSSSWQRGRVRPTGLTEAGGVREHAVSRTSTTQENELGELASGAALEAEVRGRRYRAVKRD